MKLRHAAAFAFVGWYLMVLPTEVAGEPVPSFDECGEVDFGIDPNSPCNGVFSAEPEQSPEEQWHQEEAERVDAVINKHFQSAPSKNPQHELDRWYYGSHYLRHVLGVYSRAIVTAGTTLHQTGFQGDDIGVEVDDTDGAVDEAERELPPIIDGIRVEVFPAPIDVEEN